MQNASKIDEDAIFQLNVCASEACIALLIALLQSALHAVDQFGTCFVVRRCFPKLYRVLEGALKSKHLLCVVSTAGTGQTTFLYYVAMRFLSSGKGSRVLIRIPKLEEWYLLASDPATGVISCSDMNSSAALEQYLWDGSILQLIDGCDNPKILLPHRPVKAIGFFSPRTFEAHSEWKKEATVLYVLTIAILLRSCL